VCQGQLGVLGIVIGRGVKTGGKVAGQMIDRTEKSTGRRVVKRVCARFGLFWSCEMGAPRGKRTPSTAPPSASGNEDIAAEAHPPGWIDVARYQIVSSNRVGLGGRGGAGK